MSDLQTRAAAAAQAIWKDLTDRSGVGNELEACDEGIQQEIRDAIAEHVANQFKEFTQTADLEVRLGDMHESNGRVTWVVTLARVGNGIFGNYDVYTDAIKGRAEYEAAKLRHVLGQGPRAELLDFDTDGVSCTD